MTRRIAILGLILASAALSGVRAQPASAVTEQPAREPAAVPANRDPLLAAKVALGREMFESALLSKNRQISCATCHDPDRSFADGLRQSKGIFEVAVGRNSPSLIAVAGVRGFPGPLPAPAKGARPDAPQKPREVLDLEGRCLAPIENPLEMGGDLKDAVAALRAVPSINASFDAAFGPRGIGATAERLGTVLAEFLRSLRPAKSTPYRRFLEGDTAALSDEELRGLALFKSRGRCDQCHRGSSLTDGLFHDVVAPASFRVEQQAEAARDLERELRERPRGTTPSQPSTTGRKPAILPSGRPPVETVLDHGGATGGYQSPRRGTTPGVQTLSLWDVARTAPYFRDGSVEDLETALRQHVSELRDAKSALESILRPEVVAMPGCGPSFEPVARRADLPKALKPAWPKGVVQAAPERLHEQEISDILAFLKSLSPRGA